MKTTLYIVTGLSGSGKTTAINAFEDLGFYCVDNIPVKLIPQFLKLCEDSREEINKIAFVVDFRERAFLKDFKDVISRLREEDYGIKQIFLEADDRILIRRYKESRRVHPAGKSTIEESISYERSILSDMRSSSDFIIDTGGLNPHQLRSKIIELIAERKANLNIRIISFGFKYGLPLDADMVFDVRFLPNPFFNEELKDYNGTNKEVKGFVLSNTCSQKFLDKVTDLFLFLIKEYEKEGRMTFTIAFGCRGGRHRSVVIAEEICDILKKNDIIVDIFHRDIEKE